MVDGVFTSTIFSSCFSIAETQSDIIFSIVYTIVCSKSYTCVKYYCILYSINTKSVFQTFPSCIFLRVSLGGINFCLANPSFRYHLSLCVACEKCQTTFLPRDINLKNVDNCKSEFSIAVQCTFLGCSHLPKV